MNVLTLQVGIVGEEFVDGAAGADLADNHPGRDPHPANAGFAAHHSRIVGDAIELFHGSAPFRVAHSQNMPEGIMAQGRML